jgi:hypothetical protein
MSSTSSRARSPRSSARTSAGSRPDPASSTGLGAVSVSASLRAQPV